MIRTSFAYFTRGRACGYWQSGSATRTYLFAPSKKPRLVLGLVKRFRPGLELELNHPCALTSELNHIHLRSALSVVADGRLVAEHAIWSSWITHSSSPFL